ncbi:MAG TPA: acyltransferase, partial [Opitutales bacterium]|nr:acyltransferase [Opitutales bacterium]
HLPPGLEMGSRMIKRELKCLTGLRFLLAFWVVAVHATSWSGIFLLGRLMVIPILKGVTSGYLAVSGFFVLSGFILAYNYHDRLETREQRRYFWWARVARIYPVYVFSLLVWLPFAFLNIHRGYESLGRNIGAVTLALLLVQSWIAPLAMVWNGPAWSLSDEAFFYSVAPRLTAYLRQLSIRNLIWIILGCGVVALMLTLFANWYVSGDALLMPNYATTQGWVAVGFGVTPLIRFPEFLAGYCAGLVFVQAPHSSPKLSGGVCIVAGAAIIAVADILPTDTRYVSCATLLFVPLIYFLATAPKWLENLLGNPVAEFLGEISYALYLLHMPIATGLKELFGKTALWEKKPLEMFVVYMLVAVLAASLVHLAIERPLRKVIMGRKASSFIKVTNSPSTPSSFSA